LKISGVKFAGEGGGERERFVWDNSKFLNCWENIGKVSK